MRSRMSTSLLVVIAVVSWGVWAVALRKAVDLMPPPSAYIVYSIAGLIFVPVYLWLSRVFQMPLRFPLAGTAWAAVASVLVGLGTIALLYAMRERETSDVVALTASYPLVTLVLAVLFLGEALSVSRVIGVLAIAIGAYLLSR